MPLARMNINKNEIEEILSPISPVSIEIFLAIAKRVQIKFIMIKQCKSKILRVCVKEKLLTVGL